jgi:hypothetical protein
MQKRKKSSAEYRLFVLPSYSEVAKKQEIAFRLETVREFSNFSYAIAVEERLTGGTLTWKIHGLRSPGISLPATGPATFVKKYDNLKGVYLFSITKLDGVENTFTLDISEQGVSVVKSPKQTFLEILTAPVSELTPTTET